ncbi:hypothetical protein ACS0TY_007638 [Phlomoides rotata]
MTKKSTEDLKSRGLLMFMNVYIATPKPNGYQSLHTTVIPFLYESMFRLEVQIRTAGLDLIAERGIAAHYSGKVFVNGLVGHVMPIGRNSRVKTVCLNNANVALRISWLNAIREWQEEFVGNMSSREFVETVTRDLLGSRVFVFTPRGEIKNLPKGATVIDYVYMIHIKIGNKMVAAKVNGNLVSPTHSLANAEVVEIITYNFLREQAPLSATEITADSVKEFAAESEEESKDESQLSMGSISRTCSTQYGAANAPHPDLEYDIQDLEDFGMDFSWWPSNVRLLRPRLEGGDDDDEMVDDAVGGDEVDADMGGIIGSSGQGGDDGAAP